MITARDYQINAINKFRNNQWRGILEMATGTGKTITSLLIANEYKNINKGIFLIILVPFTHLVDQWEENCELLGFRNLLKCYGLKDSWKYKLQGKVRDFNIGISEMEVVISTYKTASSIEFNEIIGEIRSRSFIIGDECHYFGIKGLRNHNFNGIDARLGLSATPDRWWDNNGTTFLREFFGDTIYEYSMEEAISNSILTEYKYSPIIIDLIKEESKRYEYFTKILINKINSKNADKEEIEEINRKRSMILSKAKNKKDTLFEIFKNKNINEVSHTLVYCAPGEINEITLQLSYIGYRVHRFDSNVPLKERGKVLKYFSMGEIKILVAIKCLDEGVDVPSTREAYFLASTSNPREFIQRRGRVLRRAKGKNLAQIYDFIVIPSNISERLYKTIVSKELPRFAEFSRYAIDRFQARSLISPYLRIYSLEYLMDKLPWDVYNEMMELREEI